MMCMWYLNNGNTNNDWKDDESDELAARVRETMSADDIR